MGPEPDIEVHDETTGTQSLSKEPMLARYVRRHHALDHIIGDKSDGTMTRIKLKGSCFEPRNVKDALDNESWVEAMNEEIE